MNPMLLAPAGLAALAALALPLLIHLARRQQQRPTVFAALRWLSARPRPRRRLRFDEPWLLAVRLLLVALLALLLAHPVLQGTEDARPRLLVAPGVEPAQVQAARAEAGADARWLAPGFPGLDQPPSASGDGGASLLREFDAALPPEAPLTVLVPRRWQGGDGARLQLSRPVEWRIAGEGTAEEPLERAAPRMAIRYDAAHRAAAGFLRAAAVAWQEADTEAPDSAASAQLPGPEPDVLAWLHAGAPPPEVLGWAGEGGQLLLPMEAELPDGLVAMVAWRDATGAPLLQVAPFGRGRVAQWLRPLAPAQLPQLLEPDFAVALQRLLLPPAAPTLVAASDYHPGTGAAAAPAASIDLRPWLALAIALLALLERWLATSRRRGAMA